MYVQSTHLIDRCPVAGGQEGVDAVARRREGRGMRALFRGHRPQPLHRPGVEHVDHAGIADRDVKLLIEAIEEDDIGNAAISGPIGYFASPV